MCRRNVLLKHVNIAADVTDGTVSFNRVGYVRFRNHLRSDFHTHQYIKNHYNRLIIERVIQTNIRATLLLPDRVC